MATFESAYKNSTFGFSGRITFSGTTNAFFAPLVSDVNISANNQVTGDNTNYSAPATPSFPLLFVITATADCRVRMRKLHPSNATLGTTAVYSKLVASCGYSNVPATTDVVHTLTFPLSNLTNLANGTNNLSFRSFNTIGSGTYGGLITQNSFWPVLVNDFSDCWIQVIPFDGDDTASAGNLIWTCTSDNTIVGY